MPITDQDQFGAFLATTQVYDLGIEQMNVNSTEFKELIVRLYQNTNNIINVLNKKDTGLYPLSEFVTGQLFFSNPALSSSTAQYPEDRQVMRKVINYTSALPNVGAVPIPHNITITANTTFTRIYAVANDPVNNSYIPLPNAGVYETSVEVDAINVIITTTANLSAYTITYIVVEYLQS